MIRKFIPLYLLLIITFLSLASPLSSAVEVKGATQGIGFCAYCVDPEEAEKGIEAGASYISVADKSDRDAIIDTVDGRVPVILDAKDKAEAEQLYKQYKTLLDKKTVCLRLNFKCDDAIGWYKEKGSGFDIICTYTGNVFFSAVHTIRQCAKADAGDLVELRSGNPYGVIMHSTVLSQLDKHDVRALFSFADPLKSAGRSDNARSWDDLISRGYTIIETRYAEDFASYLEENDAQRTELESALKKAESIDIAGCHKNRIRALNKARNEAGSLLRKNAVSCLKLSEAKLQLDEAARNISMYDKNTLKGDFAVTPARAAGAVFGVALVLSWQIYFRKHWGKSTVKSEQGEQTDEQ